MNPTSYTLPESGDIPHADRVMLFMLNRGILNWVLATEAHEIEAEARGLDALGVPARYEALVSDERDTMGAWKYRAAKQRAHQAEKEFKLRQAQSVTRLPSWISASDTVLSNALGPSPVSTQYLRDLTAAIAADQPMPHSPYTPDELIELEMDTIRAITTRGKVQPEEYAVAYRMRLDGDSYAKIGRKFGVSGTRGQQRVAKARRILANRRFEAALLWDLVISRGINHTPSA